MVNRPNSFEECVRCISSHLSLSYQVVSNKSHTELQKGTVQLLQTRSILDALKCLYDANVMVQIGFNTLSQEYAKCLTNPDSLTELCDSEVFDEKMSKLCDVCKARCVVGADESMRTLHAGMSLLSDDDDITQGMRVLYKTSRVMCTIFNLMLDRLIHGIERDNTVKRTNDVPPEVLFLTWW